jgi:hypothetical protein
MHWLPHVFGLDNASGSWYLFWSGIGSDLTYVMVFVAAWRHLNCHEPGCWRIARHHGPHCRKHMGGP